MLFQHIVDPENQRKAVYTTNICSGTLYTNRTTLIVGHPEPEKKNLLAFLSTFWHPCSSVS